MYRNIYTNVVCTDLVTNGCCLYSDCCRLKLENCTIYRVKRFVSYTCKNIIHILMLYIHILHIDSFCWDDACSMARAQCICFECCVGFAGICIVGDFLNYYLPV